MARRKRRKPVTPEENEAEYQRCLERERIRERDWRETKQGAFESSCVHIDFEAEELRERKRSASWLSDHGHGARLIYCTLDAEPKRPTREQLINRAKQRVMRNAEDCMPVFWLVIKNGSNEEESIWQLERIAEAREAREARETSPSNLKKGRKGPSTGTR